MRDCRFNFRCEPFGVTPDPKFLFPSKTHRDAMTALSYTIEHRRGFMVLLGRPGMGKTTLLYQMLQRYHSSAETSFVFQTQSTSNELLLHIAADFGIDTSGSMVDILCQLRDLFIRTHRACKTVVLVVDEAQNLSEDVLETVRLLSNYETTETKLLQIVLSGQEQLAARLHAPELTQLLQRVAVTSCLLPLVPEETSAYIMHRLRIAGAPDNLFSAAAIAEIAVRSLGIPRNINRLCFNSLALAEAANQDTVNAEVVVRADSVDDAEMIKLAHRPAARPFVVSSTTLTGNCGNIRAVAQAARARSPISTATRTVSLTDRSEQATTRTRPPKVAAKGAAHGPKKSPIPQDANRVISVADNASGNTAQKRDSQPRPDVKLAVAPNTVAPNTEDAGQFPPEDKPVYQRRSAAAQSIAAVQRKTHEGLTQFPSWGLVGAAAVVLIAVSVGAWLLYAGKVRASAQHASVPSSSSAAPAYGNRNSDEHPAAIGDVEDRSAATWSTRLQIVGRPADREGRTSKAASDASAKGSNIAVLPASPAGATIADAASQGQDAIPPSLEPIVTDRQFPSTIVSYNGPIPKLAANLTPAAPAPTTPSVNNLSNSRTQISKDAILIHRVDPVYPPVAKRLNFAGRTVLRVDIAEDGKVSAVHALNGPPLLAGAAVEAVRQWRYEPAVVDGKAHKSTKTVTVTFIVK